MASLVLSPSSALMEDIYRELVDRVIKSYADDNRILIAITGIPGSGKTTLAAAVCERINGYYQTEVAILVPMDGYHLYICMLDSASSVTTLSIHLFTPVAQLTQMENAQEAIKRRGAPFTFNPEGLLNLVKQLKYNSSETSFAPSFNHSVKDPVEDDIVIFPTHKIILFEGLYLMLNQPVWKDIASGMDGSWYIDCEKEVARERVARRHLASGLADTLEKGYERFDSNDAVNADYVVANSLKSNVIIKSINIS